MPAAKVFSVYLLTSPSGKKYVGYTSMTMARRLRAHMRDANAGHIRPLCHALRKYGIENFKVRVLRKFDTKAEALEYEILSIKRHKSDKRGFGYNATAGGECGAPVGGDWRLGKSKKEIARINSLKGLAGADNPFYAKRHKPSDLKRAVATRRERGSYDVGSGAYTLKYQGVVYSSKQGMIRETGLKREAVERLMRSGAIRVTGKSSSAQKVAATKCQKVEYMNEIFDSLGDLRDHLGFLSYKTVYRLLASGDAGRL